MARGTQEEEYMGRNSDAATHTSMPENHLYTFPKYRNLEGVSLTSLAYVDNLKPNIFTLSITVSPDHQGLALPSLSFQSFLKFAGKEQ